jgi:hypothetical protein
MLKLWGKGGYGGSPNVEAGKMYQPQRGGREDGVPAVLYFVSVLILIYNILLTGRTWQGAGKKGDLGIGKNSSFRRRAH